MGLGCVFGFCYGLFCWRVGGGVCGWCVDVGGCGDVGGGVGLVDVGVVGRWCDGGGGC